MKPNIDQLTTLNVISQMFKRLQETRDIDSPEFYTYVDNEMITLEDTLTQWEIDQIKNNIHEIYLIIKNHGR